MQGLAQQIGHGLGLGSGHGVAIGTQRLDVLFADSHLSHFRRVLHEQDAREGQLAGAMQCSRMFSLPWWMFLIDLTQG
ncbi:hypothetical protein GCM10009680_05110 [Streptomyces yatensis]|uniref:Uncharacterized protein n=1 Tax=Streptomyces yatensis TaxID=155177 RepID=A0ABN2GBH8_9ACTN